jgi:hypothetical protein
MCLENYFHASVLSREKRSGMGVQTSENKNTSAIADVMTLGMGSVVSPIPKLMTLASGYFLR